MDFGDLMTLNKQQLAAVNHNQGAILIIAGAGSGKTKTVVSKILHCIEQGIALPHEILATTFTNKATNELRHRLSQSIEDKVNYITIGTFHSISLEILQKHGSYIGISGNISVLPYEDQVQVIRTILNNKKLKDLSPSRILEKLQKHKEQASSEQKSRLTGTEEEILSQYCNELAQSKVMDFADLLVLVRDMLRDKPEVRELYRSMFKLICVDEYQDVNNIQQEMIQLLYNPNTHLCCVGDPDQAIYGFRGANCNYILNFHNVFKESKIFRLEQNYRSSRSILENANSLISHNKKRIPKNLFTESNEIKEKVRITANLSQRLEADKIAGSIMNLSNWKPTPLSCEVGDGPQKPNPAASFAILVRSRSQMQQLEEALLRYALPYTITGSVKLLDRLEVRDMLSYLKFLNNPMDTISFRRMMQAPRRGIGEVTIDRIIACSRDNRINLLSACETIATAKHVGLIELVNLLKKAKELEPKGVMMATQYILTTSKYKENLNSERLENVNQWLLSLDRFSSIKDYLDEIIWKTEANEENNSINLMTIHASKGLEFDYVYLPGWEEGTLPSGLNSEDIEEERRLAYVALTRARKLAFISYSSTKFMHGITKPANPSRFISELKDVQADKKPVSTFKTGGGFLGRNNYGSSWRNNFNKY